MDYIRKNSFRPASAIASGLVEIATDAEQATGDSDSVVSTPGTVFAIYGYDTIWVPSTAMTAKTTSGATYGEKELATNDIMKCYYSFDNQSEQFVMFDIVMPENWDRGAIRAKFYWAPSDDSGTVAKTVEWELGGVAVSNDDAMDVNITGAQVIFDTILAGENADLHISDTTPAITIAGTPALGDLIQFEASRNISGTDDYTTAALLFGILIQYKVGNTVAVWS